MADVRITLVPDILPLYLLRLAASPVWLEPDFVRGWFFTLWMRMATNELDPGYLRIDDTEVYRAAGARSREYFEKHATRMLDQNFKRDESGRWYCPRLLEELEKSRM